MNADTRDILGSILGSNPWSIGMTTMRHGAQAPARWQLFACGLALLASCLLAASAGAFVSSLPSLFSAALTPDPDARLPAPTRYL